MDSALIASAALLGLAGTPHCAAMCGAPCAALTGGRSRGSMLAFQAARMLSYAAGGAIAASSMGALASLSQFSPALRPLWTLLHALALALGLWLLWYGRQPAWMGSFGRISRALPATGVAGGTGGGQWQRLRGPVRAAAGGSVWVAWPCGLLQSALLVAAMTGSGLAGAMAMGGFALASSAGLILAPWLWQRLLQGEGAARRERWVVRSAGLLLVGASGWALMHGIWAQVAAFCATL